MTTAPNNRELDDVAAGERASVRYRAARCTVPVGDSNRLLLSRNWLLIRVCRRRPSTAAGGSGACGIYRVDRYLRFRERHVEEWLQTLEVQPWPRSSSVASAPRASGTAARTSG